MNSFDTSKAMERIRRSAPWAAGVVGTVLVLGSLFHLEKAESGVRSEARWIGSTPVTVFEPDPADELGERLHSNALPTIIIAHGFAGSQQLMRSFALTFARHGYRAVTFDFLGHGQNRMPLPGDVTEVKGATKFLVEQTESISRHTVPTQQSPALLGHSMASDIVVRCAKRNERIRATIAVSMFSPAVESDSPPNLLMVVGGFEGLLKEEAKRILAMRTADPQFGTTYGRFNTGTARRAALADGVGHVGVLYSATTLRESVAWLDNAFEHESSGDAATRGTSILLLFFGIGLVGWPLLRALPRVGRGSTGGTIGWGTTLAAGLTPAVATPLLLIEFPSDFLGVLVGGYLAMHFAVYGVLTAGMLWALARWKGVPLGAKWPSRSTMLRGLLAVVLAVAYSTGVAAFAMNAHVTAFVVTPLRLPLFLAMSLGTVAYFVADEWLARGLRAPRGTLLFTRICFLLSLALAVALSLDELFFLSIIAAFILLYFLVYGMFSRWIFRSTQQPLIGALTNAVAFAWALSVVFPIMSG